MRIISSFQDYYDGVQSQGRDDQVLYRREASLHAVDIPTLPWVAPRVDRGRLSPALSGSLTVSVQLRPTLRFGLWEGDINQTIFRRAYVLVGGRAHAVWLQGSYLGRSAADPLVVRANDFKPDQWKLAESAPTSLGDPDLLHAIEAWMASRRQDDPTLNPADAKVNLGDRHLSESLRWEEFKTDPVGHVPDLFREHERFHVATLERDWTALHLDHDAPVLLLFNQQEPSWWGKSSQAPSWLVRNPRLKDVRLGSLLDSYALFQEVSMFIGGVMPGQQSPMVQVSDRTQVLKKGFDPVYGFRRRPQTSGT